VPEQVGGSSRRVDADDSVVAVVVVVVPRLPVLDVAGGPAVDPPPERIESREPAPLPFAASVGARNPLLVARTRAGALLLLVGIRVALSSAAGSDATAWSGSARRQSARLYPALRRVVPAALDHLVQ